MTKIVMALRDKVDHENAEKQVFTFKYLPVKAEYEKRIKLVVTCEDPFDLMGALDLPQGIGDTANVEFNTKQLQAKLTYDKKKGKD